MPITAEHLKALAASLNSLSDTIDQIAKNLVEQPATAPAPEKSAPRKKSGKKAPAKKSVPKKKSTKASAKKSTPMKKPAKAKPKKSAKKPTKMDVVLETIRRARKSIDTAALLKRTGFDKRTISYALYRLKKDNKIKSLKKGVYTKA